MCGPIDGIVLRLLFVIRNRARAGNGRARCYAVCAARSGDPRVHQLKVELEQTIKPHLRLVSSR